MIKNEQKKTKNSTAKKLLTVAGVTAAISTVALATVAVKNLPDSRYASQPEEKNPFEGKLVKFVFDEKDSENADGKKGHLEPVCNLEYKASFYDKYVKRAMDILTSAGGLIVLAPVFAGISIAIQIDDPGTVLFCQKRVGKNKQYFKLHKFRSMKMSTPKDVPTHMLDNPEEYITRVGKFLRAHSLDELPQIWDIFIGNMSVIGPRPGLWNQELLMAERDKYNVSVVRPGLTGLAQISGRDELEIEDKARLDGEYVNKQSLALDTKLFLNTINKVVSDTAVVEGGTGTIKNNKKALILVNHPITVYNFRFELVEKLLKDNYEVHISSPGGKKIQELINLGCVWHNTSINRRGKNPVDEFVLLTNYKKLFKKIKPDIILAYTIKPNIYGAMVATKYNIPFIANITGLGTAIENNKISSKILLKLYKYAFEKVDTVFFQNSNNMQLFYNNNIALGRHRLIPGSGVNLEKFKYLEYPDIKNVVSFCFVSRVMKDKGIDLYLQAAKKIKEKYPNTKFHVCGFCEEDYESKLNDYHNQGIIKYHGMINDISSFYKDKHCLIHPSFHEGMSNVCLEAAATGRPIIASEISGCIETFDEGITGFGFEAKNTVSLISTIEKFIQLPYNEKIKMGVEGRKKIKNEFDRNIVIKEYMNSINNIVKEDK